MPLAPDSRSDLLPTERPTKVRHLVVAVTTLMSFLLYLDRFCYSFAERLIKQDLGLSDTQIAWTISAFFWSYALAQVPTGWLSDRYGARIMLTLYVLTWSVFTALIGFSAGIVALVLFRLGLGLSQAGAYPTAAALVGKWATFTSRGIASSIIAFGGRVGGAVAPPLTAILIVVFVPLDVSSLLTPPDILNVEGLCAKLRAGSSEESSPAARLYSMLSAPAREFVADCPPPDVMADIPESKVGQLVDSLNEVLRRPDFYEPQAFSSVTLASEAKRLLKQRDELDTPGVERLNRLALEAAFGDEIKMIYVSGWRPVMVVYGVAGLIVVVVLWLTFRNRPSEHPSCNAAEVALIESSRPADAANPHGAVEGIPILCILRSGTLWLVCVAQMGTNIGWMFLVTWLARYLQQVHSVPIELRGWMASVPLFAGMAGGLLGGWLTDRLTKSIGVHWGRVLPISTSRFVAAGAFVACLAMDSPWPIVIALSVVSFATDIGSPALWAFSQDVGGRHTGSILGWSNMWGNLGAAIAPPLLNWVILGYDWNTMFLTCAGSFVIAGVASLFINPSAKIIPESCDQ